ncbi:TMEM1 family protein, putative [Trichophyton verrucosum HKI 0517]|uniref:TMEM1 family protein, putative n=1 Tax=Trichophyton verrucosum (strain HKI 0517) TaxID=663202 RepID=D4D933_TRIVH|nr:TMEM1 family protein, putative [Trichophyton verrucosum HKI 0517]EFE41602.1 TMEM1 family protein, putative [Trichophyton verrucosum HKI 0517]
MRKPDNLLLILAVEYTDPFGLFPQVKPLLSQVLPLRNLHWKSSTRPVRSIDSLQIDFKPAHTVADDQKRLSDGASGAVSQRRHQIPGLLQTPYLKIYLLRCDDNETYKTTSRKTLREWIKTRTSAAPTGPDNHDAFEWLILHVIPSTAPSPEVTEKAAPSKWPGRGSTSVLEKVKADFNGSSKTAVDRVAQLRIPKADADKKQPELTAQLDDLVAKLKYFILTSFDLRVGQYEADIREKDSQRSLPGWNFCTFFILKEGLSLGLENVGLFEDALIGYDELAVGLDSALRDQISGTGDQHGGTFLNYSKDLRSKAEAALAAESSEKAEASSSSEDEDGDEGEDDNDGDHDELFSNPIALDQDIFPLQPQQKPYRDMILANNISVFDFRVYIFSRQLLLLLKAARSPPSNRQSGSQKNAEKHNLTLLAEICERASEFITLACRTLRKDVETGLAQLEQAPDPSRKEDVITNIVSSWAYAAVSQVLIQTSTKSLEIPKVSLRTSKDLVDAAVLTSFATGARPGVPKRTSSLMSPTSRPSSGLALNPLGTIMSAPQKAGGIELAAAQADLYHLARCQLGALGRRRGWGNRWHSMPLLLNEKNGFTEVSLSDEPMDKKRLPVVPTSAGVETPCLALSVESKKKFNCLYERITDQIFRHNIAANRFKSAEIMMADIALLKYETGDYALAASYFHQLSNFYRSNGWETLEGTMVELYSRCLKQLDRKDEFVHALLRLLGIYSSTIQHSLTLQSSMHCKVEEYVEDLFAVSQSLSKTFPVLIKDFFRDIQVQPGISHFQDRDGFQAQLSLRYALGEKIKIDNIKMRLVNALEIPNNELWLENSDSTIVKSKGTKVLLDSSTTVHGKYYVDRIEMRAGNITFTQDYDNQVAASHILQDTTSKSLTSEAERPYVVCFPAVDAFVGKVSQSRSINLVGHRSLDIELSSGWNDISTGCLRLRPATAGLRLIISESSLIEGALTLCEEIKGGRICFTSFARASTATLRVPYSMEGTQTSLSVSVEAEYETPKGQFEYISSSSVVSTLPVSVNVQDLFQDEQLFSRFSISPGMLIPIRVFSCEMKSSGKYDVQTSVQEGEIMDVFPKQPASLLYKIRPRDDFQPDKDSGSTRPLSLSIEFACLNEECLSVLEDRFTKDVEASPFAGMKQLLVPFLQTAFSAIWTAHTLETIGLTREIEVYSYERMQWREAVESMDGDTQTHLVQWLREWHNTNKTIPLPNNRPVNAVRHITIPVDIPDVQVVHTARLLLKDISPGQTHVGVDDMISAELIIRHTRRWCEVAEQEPQSSIEFTYEIIASPDMWVIGGRRRGNFTCAEGEEKRFQLLLLPQRAGHLLLPSVDIKSFATGPGQQQQQQQHRLSSPTGGEHLLQSDNSFAPRPRRLISSELDYRSHGETILVSADLQMTTINLDGFGDAAAGSWHDAERKTDAAVA